MAGKSKAGSDALVYAVAGGSTIIEAEDCGEEEVVSISPTEGLRERIRHSVKQGQLDLPSIVAEERKRLRVVRHNRYCFMARSSSPLSREDTIG